jgi:foldase protein PrsA
MDTTNIEPSSPNQPEIPKQELNFLKKINPKLAIIAIVLVAILGLLFYYKNLFIAASVDGHFISRWSVIKKLEKQGGKSVLDSLVEETLINNKAKENNITVSDSDVNGKLDTIRAQVEGQGGTLDAALSAAGITLDDLKKQIMMQLKLERLLADKINVSEEELNKYITDNKVENPTEEDKTAIREQLKSGKFSEEASKYLIDLRVGANIKNFVEY